MSVNVISTSVWKTGFVISPVAELLLSHWIGESLEPRGVKPQTQVKGQSSQVSQNSRRVRFRSQFLRYEFDYDYHYELEEEYQQAVALANRTYLSK